MGARQFILSVLRTARQKGFGTQSGRTIRATIGYKFDSMSATDVLVAMGAPDFLPRYRVTLDNWYAALDKSASAETLKRNADLHNAALALADDAHSFGQLIESLKILCERNQTWYENGQNVKLPFNGHSCLLSLFGINVTNSRRIRLTESAK
jgi:hypothetical protein